MKVVLLAACFTVAISAWGTRERFDVVVYGATSGGVAAAIGAAQEGRSVALVEPGRHVGGMLSGGLGRTDMDRQQNVIGGMAREFFERAGRVYGEPVSWLFEPHVAEQIRPTGSGHRVLSAKLRNLGRSACFGSLRAGLTLNLTFAVGR